MTSNYKDIESLFLGYISDFDITTMSDEEMDELLVENLHKVLAQPFIQNLFSSISFDDDEMILTYTLKTSASEASDKIFIEDVLAQGLVIGWLTPQVNTMVLTKQLIGTSKEKFYSQSNQLNEMEKLLNSTKVSLKKMVRDAGSFNNSYINNEA